MQTTPQEPLQRVSGHDPCPLCGAHKGCSYNDYVILCKNVTSDKPAQGGVVRTWIHYRDDAPAPDRSRSRRSSPPRTGRQRSKRRHPSVATHTVRVPKAPIWRRHRVYCRLIQALSLEREDHQRLRDRGLSDEAIRKAGFRTLPLRDRSTFVNAAAGEHHPSTELAGVPGFYWNQTTDEWKLGGFSGTLIPVMDDHQRISACMIRLRPGDPNVDDFGKYTWMSSNPKPDKGRFGGASSGAPTHVAHPVSLETEKVLWLTEGALKATVAAHLSGYRFLGVAGTSAWRQALPLIGTYEPQGVVVAYDADLVTNEHVREAAKNLAAALLQDGWSVALAFWPLDVAKGIDDLYAMGEQDHMQYVHVKRPRHVIQAFQRVSK